MSSDYFRDRHCASDTSHATRVHVIDIVNACHCGIMTSVCDAFEWDGVDVVRVKNIALGEMFMGECYHMRVYPIFLL